MTDKIEDGPIIELVDLVDEGPYAEEPHHKKVVYPEDKKKAPIVIDVKETIVQEVKTQVSAALEDVKVGIEKDIIAATRSMLPEIVEKVVREEIEKLKKIKE
jgi:cell pole-organizing protein PopZ